jgi:hypothetical protein
LVLRDRILAETNRSHLFGTRVTRDVDIGVANPYYRLDGFLAIAQNDDAVTATDVVDGDLSASRTDT